MIDIFTRSRSPFTTEYWKSVARTASRKYSGPQAVRDSLMRGLAELGVPYTLDPRHPSSHTAVVLSGTAALREQINRKKKGVIEKLYAGPNIAILPTDHDALLCDPAIDRVLVPSAWVKDVYTTHAPAISGKISVWPAGVANAAPSSRERLVIMYEKFGNERLTDAAIAAAHGARYEVCVLRYGAFTQSTYLDLLAHAGAVVYFSQSESQGIALQEAWMRNVPTFVYQTGTVTTKDFTWADPKINAPYLEPAFGAFKRAYLAAGSG